MIPHLRPACLVLGLVATATPAAAQNWYYENGARWSPAGAGAYTVAPSPYTLAPTQRTIVDRTVIPQGNGRAPIVRERVVTDTYGSAPAVTGDYAYVPRTVYTAPVADSYAYVPPATYTAPVVDSYAYVPATTYAAPVDSYAYVPRATYTEPVVESYYWAPRPPLAVGESYAYVPNSGVAAPRVVYQRDTGSCALRYRSYDAASGTFLGYDGRRHPCP